MSGNREGMGFMARLEKHLNRQKSGRAKRSFVIVGILLAVMAVASAAYYWFGGALPGRTKENGSIVSPDHKINIMVMGVDERSDDVGRSDTLFVLTVDTNTKEVAMLSVPRDTRVKIPGKSWDKINHAYAFGGQKLSQQAVEDLLGIKIDRHIEINIAGFKKIIDAMGGVTIDVEKRMYYNDPYDDDGGLVIDLRPGVQHMDGRTAIQYVRYRDEEGDIGRVERQQKFLKAVLNQVASPSVITKIPAIIREVSSVVKSDMSTSEMLNLAKILSDASKKGLKTDMVPGKPGYIDDVSYWLPDLMALRKHVAQTLGVSIEEKYLSVTQREATEYETSIPKEMKIVEKPKLVQVPKPATVSDKPKIADKSKTGDKPGSVNNSNDPSKSATKNPASGKVRVEVINASGTSDAGDKIASTLRGQGIEVTGVMNVTNAYKNTVIVTNTTDSGVVNKLTGLPFKYSMNVTNDESKSTDAVVVIGKDYEGK
ncbi:MAG: cell envelope-related transcriptional attenuator [Firmicutes bacterium]|nr:cell envelope-related transcriptional attenuator [Bacillota bacterium]